jgi:hypothetical protein
MSLGGGKMFWETLSVWFWIGYYLFILMIFTTAVISLIKKRRMAMSMIAILLTISVPMVSLINSIGRPVDSNEFEFLAMELKHGALWAIFTFAGYTYMLVWFVLFFKKKN